MDKAQSQGSKTAARGAIKIALTETRAEEKQVKEDLAQGSIYVAAVDFGGEALAIVPKIIERAVVAAKREGIIKDNHAEEGAIAGATHEIVSRMMSSSIGLNMGGKIGIARYGEHLCVAVFCAIGMIHLDDVTIGIAHRAVGGY